jgi:hypothetical protein
LDDPGGAAHGLPQPVEDAHEDVADEELNKASR